MIQTSTRPDFRRRYRPLKKALVRAKTLEEHNKYTSLLFQLLLARRQEVASR